MSISVNFDRNLVEKLVMGEIMGHRSCANSRDQGLIDDGQNDRELYWPLITWETVSSQTQNKPNKNHTGANWSTGFTGNRNKSKSR